MSTRTRISGTNHDIIIGRARIGGTNYTIKKGVTRIGGTLRNIVVGDYETFTTSVGSNFKGGAAATSHIIGWDNRLTRIERYSFTTGNTPVASFQFQPPNISLYLGGTIALKYGISTSATAFINASGASSGGYSLTINAVNTCNQRLEANTTYYLFIYPGTILDQGYWFGEYSIASNTTFGIKVTQYA